MFSLRSCAALGATLLVISCGSGVRPERIDGAASVVSVNGYRLAPGKEPSVPGELDDLDRGAGQPVPGAPETRDEQRRRWIVVLSGPATGLEQRALAEAGAHVAGYLPEHAYLASMTESARVRVERLPFVRGLIRHKAAYKIDPALRTPAGAIVVDGGPAAVELRTETAEGLGAALSFVRRQGGKVLRVGGDVARVELERGQIAALAQLEEVLSVADSPQPQVVNDTSRWVIQSNVSGSTPVWDEGLHGEGQVVGIGDTGLDYDMCWFRDPAGTAVGPGHRKVVGYRPWTDAYDGDMGHGSHVAGTVAGDQVPITGQTSANGMAPAALLHMSDLTPGEVNAIYPPADLGDLFQASYDVGARIHTNSWGAASNAYGSMCFTTDRYLWEHKDVLVLFANNNSGPAPYSVGSPATAKNVVSVGATLNGAQADSMAAFSSHGPTYDGRLKPTLSAPGVSIVSADSDGLQGSDNCGTIHYSGTSMATPTVAGAAALVRQYFVDGYWPSGMKSPADGFEPSAALLKAMLVNAAQDMSGSGTDGPIPSGGQGWGRLNLSTSLRFAGDTQFLEVLERAAGLSTGQSHEHWLHATGERPLKVTLVWTDYPASEGAVPALVNDLDLVVTGPGGAVYRGNAFEAGASVPGGDADRLNVEEQVLLPQPIPGAYTVRVVGHHVPVGPQPFALVVSGGGGISSRGYLGLDRGRYGASTAVTLKVVDSDLDLDRALREETTVSIVTAGGDAEIVSLAETGPSTAILVGALPTAPAPAIPGNGVLELVDTEAILATYLDADDGTGAPATVTASATADLQPPVVTEVSVTAIEQSGVTVVFRTSEPSSGRVLYGETPALGATAEERVLGLEHDLALGGLREDTTYRFAVEAVDEGGTLAREDAGGALLTFTTALGPPTIRAFSSAGSTTYASETLVHGTALDPSGVTSVTVNGAAVGVRAADGYFEATAPLAHGLNAVTVVATDGLGQVATTVLTIERLRMPNLVVTSVSAPASAGLGMPFEVSAVVCNAGEGDVTDDYVAGSWFVSDDEVLGAGDLFLGSYRRIYSQPAAGTCMTVVHSVSAGYLSLLGRAVHVGLVAGLPWQEEESYDDNARVSPATITFDPADVAFVALSAPGSVLAQAPFEISATLANPARGRAAAFPVNVYLSEDDSITPADRLVASYYPGGLDAGSTLVSTVTATLGNDLAPGSYRLGAIADPAGILPEADETNNTFVGGWVTLVGTDLRVATLVAPPFASPGSTIVVHDVVAAAQGGGGAGAFNVGYYLSPDPIITTSDLPIGGRWVSSLAPGASSAADTAVTLPATWPGGAAYIGVVVDPSQVMLESDEQNNTAAAAIEIAGIDLVAESVTAPPEALQGEVIEVTSTVSASPFGSGAPPFHVGVFLSPDPVIDRSDSLVGTRLVAGLLPGEASSASTQVMLPAALPPGTWYLGVIADDFPLCEWNEGTEACDWIEDLVPEVDVTNNALAAAATQVAGPDVELLAVSGPATARAGRTIAISTSVKAMGPVAAGRFQVSFYLSTDPIIDTSDTYLGSRTVTSLPAGATSTATTSIVLSRYAANGTFRIGAIADPTGMLVEANEANNAKAGGTIVVTGGQAPPG